MSFIFGGNTGQSYEDIQNKRKIAEQLLAQNAGSPRNVGEGLTAIGRALAYRNITKKADAADATNKAAFNEQWSGLFAGGSPSGATPSFTPVDPNSPSVIGDQTMAALGKSSNNFHPGNRESFISAMMPHAVEASKMTGVDPRLIVAQAAQETGWGAHAPGNNYFGIKSHGQGGGNTLATTEYVNGQPVTVNDSFRGYGGMRDSAMGYAKFLLENPRYKPMLQANGLDAQVAALGQSGYATDPNYAASVGNIANGIDPRLIEAMGNPYASPGQKAVAAALLQQQMDAADPAKKLALEKAQLEIDKLKNPAAAGSPEYGLNPIVTQDEQGKYHLFQIPKDGGKPKEVELPYGWTPQQQYLDTGTGFVAAPKQGTAANLEPVVTKDVAGKAAETAVGEAAGAAQVALPGAAQAAADVAAQVESLKNDEYLPNMLGPVDSLLPNVSEDAARVQGKMNQIQGGAFLQARQLLKGGGAITDYEGQKAEAAFARLAAAQNPEDYKAALDEFNYFVQQGLKKLEAQAAMTSKPQDAPSGSTYTFNPETGELE